MIAPARYVGRFAPSPTGPLHFGSLVAALGSYLDARAANGRWLVRMEDIDPPREVAGAAAAILTALEAYGLTWDDTVLYQSTRLDHYRAAIDTLLAAGLAYRCRCTRRGLARTGHRVYPGTCRNAQVPATVPHAVRVLTDARPTGFVDRLQGRCEQALETATGDYVVLRRDGLYAYQLAVSLDDHDQGITDVVRGGDLLDSTPRQIHVRALLGLPDPVYAHLPVVIGPGGAKLSKQTGAPGLDLARRGETLHDALRALQQQPPAALRGAPVGEQLDWAIKHWDIDKLQGIHAVEPDKTMNVILVHRNGPTLKDSGR